MSWQKRNLFEGQTKSVSAFEQFAATAAGTGDDSEVTSSWIDRLADTPNAPPLCAKLIVPVFATLGSGNTLRAVANFQDVDDTANTAADHGDALASTVILTGPSGGGEVGGVIELPVDLSGAQRFIRAQVTIDMDRTGTDTATIGHGVIELAGFPELPPS